jgi:alpha-D-xyloside xylohydrolase
LQQGNDFMRDMLDLETPEAAHDVLWRACIPQAAEAINGDVYVTVPFEAQRPGLVIHADHETPRKNYRLRLRAYGPEVIRFSIAFLGDLPGDEGPMLALDKTLTHTPLNVREAANGWEVYDDAGCVRARVRTQPPATRHWSDLLPTPEETLDIDLLPDGQTVVPLMAWDQFVPHKHDAMALAVVERAGTPHRGVYAFHAAPNEHFAGTGERFARLDLAGRTIVLDNVDALGVNNRRAYKNIPFYLSSRPYGLFLHTSTITRLSFADISTRAAQGLVNEPVLDLFVIGGPTPERILYNYRRLTGFPADVPLWSYGVWMSRMTYFSAAQVSGVAQRLRKDGFPCDVLHIDTGWFSHDWLCDWEFDPVRFPDPAGFLAELRRSGFRVCLWQTPNIAPRNKLAPEARRQRYIAPPRDGQQLGSGSDFGEQGFGGVIDFSNPAAVAWYQGLLARLLAMGVAAIKTDFGEDVPVTADYRNLPGEKLHNLYALLYQKAAHEVTQRVKGEGVIWARSAWAGSQRYPVHWGGDAACSWDGMASSLRAGLHLGLSGFGFWSHDVPGFHGVPNFMNNWPPDTLYVRWTQFGVFTSHIRYHGSTPREPYEYPAIAGTVREWWRLRYALIPYLATQGRLTTQTGLPVLRALVLHHADDPVCWHLDDEFYCGDDILVAPVMNDTGTRDVYLPAGEWVDFWTGERINGARWLPAVHSPLTRLPLYVRAGARLPVYPQPVACTDDMDPAAVTQLSFDESYHGLASSCLSFIHL